MLIDKGCFDRGCACASSKDVAGEDGELVEVVRYRELDDDEILIYANAIGLDMGDCFEFSNKKIIEFAKAILRKAQEK